MTASTPVVPYDLSVSRQGKLADTAPLIVPASHWPVRQHNYVRSHEAELREQGRFPANYDKNHWFWTGDGSNFTNLDGEPANILTDPAFNLVMRHPKEAARQLLSKQGKTAGNYVPPVEEARESLAAVQAGYGSIVRIKPLNLKRENDEWGYIVVKTRTAADKLSGEPRVLLEHAHGRGVLLEDSMRALYDAGLEETALVTLMPGYVERILGEDVEAFARASGLGRLDNGSGFDAVGRLVDDRGGRARGGRRVVAAEGGTPQKDPVAAAIDTLVANPAQAKGKLNREDAAALGRISIDVLANQ